MLTFPTRLSAPGYWGPYLSHSLLAISTDTCPYYNTFVLIKQRKKNEWIIGCNRWKWRDLLVVIYCLLALEKPLTGPDVIFYVKYKRTYKTLECSRDKILMYISGTSKAVLFITLDDTRRAGDLNILKISNIKKLSIPRNIHSASDCVDLQVLPSCTSLRGNLESDHVGNTAILGGQNLPEDLVFIVYQISAFYWCG